MTDQATQATVDVLQSLGIIALSLWVIFAGGR